MRHVRQDVPAEDARVRDAEGVRRLDVFELRELERLAAQQAREPGPAGEAEDRAQDQQAEVGAQRAVANQSALRSMTTCIISTAAAMSSTPGMELSVV
jgi:hypothetical protein